MGFFAGLLFGALGWTLFGPIGAILGGIFGLNVLSGKEKIDGRHTSSEGGSKDTTHGDFMVVLLILIATVMKADGKVSKSELDEVKKFLLRNFSDEESKEALQLLKQILSQNYDYRSVCIQASTRLNYSAKLELLHLLFKISAADGIMSESEMQVITEISRLIGISSADFHSVRAAYMAYNREQRQGGGSSSSSTGSKGMSLSLAYQILEVSPDASDSEIKKAYRKMAMKYHPDKVNTLGDDVRKSATEKFKAVNEAYNTVKAARGFA